MRTGTSSQISAAGKQFHCPQVDFLIAPHGRFHRLMRFGKSGGVQNDIIVRVSGESRKQVKYIGDFKAHFGFQPVETRIAPGHFHRVAGDIYRMNVRGSGFCCIERKGAGMGKTVQHPLSGARAAAARRLYF